MSQCDEKLLASITKELEAYKKDTSSLKPYFQSMKEISAWLAAKEK